MKKLSLSIILCCLFILVISTIAYAGISRPAFTPYIAYDGQVVDSITYCNKTINVVYAKYRSGLETDWTYGCFVLPRSFYSSVYGITVSDLNSTTSVPQASRGSFIETRTPRKGDIIRCNTGSSHWALVKSVNGSTVTVIQQNAWWNSNTCAQVGCTVDAYDTDVSFFTYSDYCSDTEEFTGSEMTSGAGRTIPDGDYEIVNLHNPSYGLDISGDLIRADDLSNVDLWSRSTPAREQDIFTVEYLDNGFYSIKQKGTDMSLDVDSASNVSGANIQMYHWHESIAQQWSISINVKDGNPLGYCIQARCSGFALDVPDGKISQGANIQQWPCNQSYDQTWLMIPAGNPSTIPDGDYEIVSLKDSSYGLDISGDLNVAEDLSNVDLWSRSTPAREQDIFTVEYLDNGLYSIKQKGTDKALDVDSASIYSGANVQIYNWHDSPAQQWAILETSVNNSNGYVIMAACSGFALDIEGGNVGVGTNIRQFPCNNTASQVWAFVPYIPEALNNNLVTSQQQETEAKISGVAELGVVAEGEGLSYSDYQSYEPQETVWETQEDSSTFVVESEDQSYDTAETFADISYENTQETEPETVAPTVNFSKWENGNYTYIKDTDASIGQQIDVYDGECTEAGMYLYDKDGNELGSSGGEYYYRVYFKINEELGVQLEPGTKYKYKFYAVVNGETYWGKEGSFKTKEDANTTTVNFSKWENGNYTYIRETDASIGQQIDVDGGECTEAGMYLYDKDGNELGSSGGEYYYRVYFKINEELGVQLEPGTKYKYKFYAVVNGKTYWGKEDSFKTNG